MNTFNLYPTEFVKQSIDQLVSLFPNIRCAYELDESEDEHLVEITPNHFFESSDELLMAHSALETDFHRLFPYHALYFISDTALYPVKNPIYTKTGDRFYNLLFSDLLDFNSENLIQFRDSNIETAILQAGESNYALAA